MTVGSCKTTCMKILEAKSQTTETTSNEPTASKILHDARGHKFILLGKLLLSFFLLFFYPTSKINPLQASKTTSFHSMSKTMAIKFN
jgi:hypothetical protein